MGERINTARTNKDWPSLIEGLNKVIDRNPNDANAYFGRALGYSNLDEIDPQLVISDLNNCLELESVNYKAKFLRAQALMIIQEYDEAKKDLDQLNQTIGESPFLLIWKGNRAFLNKDFEEAENAYGKRMYYSGGYNEMKSVYYYWIFSRYFGDKRDKSIWDAALLESRGFEKDSVLIDLIHKEELNWVDLAQFPIQNFTLEVLDSLLNNTKLKAVEWN